MFSAFIHAFSDEAAPCHCDQYPNSDNQLFSRFIDRMQFLLDMHPPKQRPRSGVLLGTKKAYPRGLTTRFATSANSSTRYKFEVRFAAWIQDRAFSTGVTATVKWSNLKERRTTFLLSLCCDYRYRCLKSVQHCGQCFCWA